MAVDRRALLRTGGSFAALGLAGCATRGAAPLAAGYASTPSLAPVRATVDRPFDITVCLRPFRAAGPRIESETVDHTQVIHNYGHGGSGWSLSWGSGTLAVRMAMASSPREIAVIGCGALGITAAILAQEAGAKVTIYARDLLPDTRSARATGSWTGHLLPAIAEVRCRDVGQRDARIRRQHVVAARRHRHPGARWWRYARLWRRP
jgi:glycine/D-amino acid oxidase-like deaminating enzyme